MRSSAAYNPNRVTRKFIKIACQKCSYYRGVQDEHGIIKCGMCGEIQ